MRETKQEQLSYLPPYRQTPDAGAFRRLFFLRHPAMDDAEAGARAGNDRGRMEGSGVAQSAADNQVQAVLERPRRELLLFRCCLVVVFSQALSHRDNASKFFSCARSRICAVHSRTAMKNVLRTQRIHRESMAI